MAVAAPKNLKITRVSGNKFTISWNLGSDKYGAQELIWYEHYKKKGTDKNVSLVEHKVSIGNKTTSKDIAITFSNYPATGTKRLYYISAKVRGKKDKTYSSWAKATYDIKIPNNVKSLTKPGTIGENANEATFSWDITDSGANVFYQYQYQFAEVTNYAGTDLSKIDWAKNKVTGWTLTTAKTITRQVNTLPVGNNTLTLFFRIRAYGPQGFSKTEAVSWHVFGAPKKAKVYWASSRPTTSGSLISVNWESPYNTYGYPIDKTVVEYAVGTPNVTRTVDSVANKVIFSLQPPANPSWQTRDAVKDTAGRDTLTFDTDTKAQNDECTFVRVNNHHDKDSTTTYGDITFTKNGDIYGKLSPPAGLSAAYVPETRRVSITVQTGINIPNSYLAVYARSSAGGPSVIGIMPQGTTTGTYIVPENIANGTNIAFGVKALVADYSPTQQSVSEATVYTIYTPYLMESETVWDGGQIVEPPTLSLTDLGEGTILAEWDWSWLEAQSAELSWATSEYAWESTEAPQTYTINNNCAGRWRISGLEYGETYYVRVRLIHSGADYETFGLYSDPVSITISADAPPIPILILDPAVVAPDGEVRCSWAYAAEDGSTQVQADISEVIVENNETTYRHLVDINTVQSAVIDLAALDPKWEAGSPHDIVVRTFSSFGTVSAYSAPATLRVADPLELDISLGTGFGTKIVNEETVNTLTGFPFTMEITGAGDNGTTALYIRRLDGHPLERPDESKLYGYANEAIVIVPEDADGQITITADSGYIFGSLDDGEWYTITAMANDGYGQIATNANDPIKFIVDWDHKAQVPSAVIDIDYDYNVAMITPTAESEISPGDVCDIYRLSSGKPELVYQGAEFGTKYVDLYPAIGQFGGYRLVYRTKYNDYITADGTFAWTDYGYSDGAALDIFDAIIDFDGEQVSVPFNLDLSHTWKKEFNSTRYLGGAIQGDWKDGVDHTLKVTTDVAVKYFSDTYILLRKLADYAGVCHIRTPDGSSFSADIQVAENQEKKKINMVASFSLDITRVDREDSDGDGGMLFSEWNVNAE